MTVTWRLRHWLGRKTGIGYEWAEWLWCSRLRHWLSYRLGIGDWFGGSEECERCGALAADCDYEFVRVARRRARCRLGCDGHADTEGEQQR